MPVEETNMNKAYLLIGGNIGNRNEYLSTAAAWIENRCGPIKAKSSIYETEAWGLEAQSAFLNQALLIETTLSAPELLSKILAIEEAMGRKRAEKYGPRIIDIDIIFYNDDIIELPHLTIPHPHMQNRRFVLTPLCEISPSMKHPVFHKSIAELLAECPDPLTVHKIS